MKLIVKKYLVHVSSKIGYPIDLRSRVASCGSCVDQVNIRLNNTSEIKGTGRGLLFHPLGYQGNLLSNRSVFVISTLARIPLPSRVAVTKSFVVGRWLLPCGHFTGKSFLSPPPTSRTTDKKEHAQ